MLINHNSRITRNIARYFFLPFFVDETSETPNVNIVSVAHVALNNSKKSFNRGGNIALVNSGLVCNLVDDV